MLSAVALSPLAYAPAVMPSATVTRAATPSMGFGKTELMALAKEQNPIVGFYDPMGLADLDLWGQGEEASIGWLRHAEIKHGRIAMFGFVGFIVHSNHITFPWPGPQSLVTDSMSAPEVWDSLPFVAKLQIIGAIGIFEHISEDKNFLAADGTTHYMRGGKPGYMPTFKANVHPSPLNLFVGVNHARLTEAEKAKKLNMEVNNGRLAMIGLFGFISESCVPGSVPSLTGLIPTYSGDVMAPFLPAGGAESFWTIGNVWS